MELLQIREKEIFETIKSIQKFDFVLIGGYAVNAYTLPRFSVDCDIVANNKEEANKIGSVLEDIGYKKEENRRTNYEGLFARYEKGLNRNFKVSVDILIMEVIDRRTKASFNSKWVFENSSYMILKGKTITEQVRLRIIGLDALVAMKFVSCRNTDIRDIFMLFPYTKRKEWVKEQIKERCKFEKNLQIIKESIGSKKFKDNLQGVYGYIDDSVFNKHKECLLIF